MRNSGAQWSWVLYEGTAALFLISLCETGRTEGLIISIAIMAVLAPMIGSISDGKGRKKMWFLITFLAGIAGIIASALLFGNSARYILALVGFFCTLLLHDAFMTDVCNEKQSDEISAAGCGWFILCCILSLWLLQAIRPKGLDTKILMLLSAAWAIALFVPSLFVVRHRHEALPADRKWVGEALHTIRKTATAMAKNRKILMFVLSCFFLTAGVAALGYSFLKQTSLSDVFAGSQRYALWIAVPVTLACGIASRRFGSVKTLIFVILLCMIGCIMDWFLPGSMIVMIGAACGGLRSASRAYFAKIIPRDRAGAYFGISHCPGCLAMLVGVGMSFLPLTNLVVGVFLLISCLILGLQRKRLREFKE